jgi:hypothetical protein
VAEAELDEHRSGQARRVAVVAEDDDPALVPADAGIPPRARRIDPPFQHRAREVQRARHDPVARPRRLRADVDEQRAARGRSVSRGRLEPIDAPAGALQQLRDPGYFANSTARLSRITVTLT